LIKARMIALKTKPVRTNNTLTLCWIIFMRKDLAYKEFHSNPF
jgi:hypothetical protein